MPLSYRSNINHLAKKIFRGFKKNMQIMKVNNINYAPSFNRRLRADEKKEYRVDTIQQAYNYLGIKQVAMIMHGSCYPADNFDMGIGSPIGNSASEMAEFEVLHGFSANQQGPLGMISRGNYSPYSSSIFAKNYMFIDAGQLTRDKYANILDKKVLEQYELPDKKLGENYTNTQFSKAFDNYDKIIDIAYNNFRTKVRNEEPKAIELNKEFKKYKTENSPYIVKEGVYQVLKKYYHTGDFNTWDGVDKDLFGLIEQKNPEAIARYKEIIKQSGKQIDEYCFAQFLVEKQIKENKNFRKNLGKTLNYAPKEMLKDGFVYINDFLVGGSKMDEYINPGVFSKNWRLGCPSGGTYGVQMWDAPVAEPEKLFNPDGSLGPSGKFLKRKINSMLASCENVRVDHAIGLYDPYLYDKSSIVFEDGNLRRDLLRAGRISELGIDPEGNYKKIVEKIVIPAMEKKGLKPEDAVWEDLGWRTDIFNDIHYNKLHLPGITQLEWDKAEGSPRKNWALIGSHDSVPAIKLVNENLNSFNDDKSPWNPLYLAGFLHWDPARAQERDAFCKKVASNPIDRVKARFAELFMNSEKIQIAFPDFFGINAVYNYGGKTAKSNWKLRMSKDWEDEYYKNLSSDNPTALNLPEILSIAVKAQMDREYIQCKNSGQKDAEAFKQDLKQKMQPLLDRLDKFTQILKEKEE